MISKIHNNVINLFYFYCFGLEVFLSMSSTLLGVNDRLKAFFTVKYDNGHPLPM
jgi:hypothetical protein